MESTKKTMLTTQCQGPGCYKAREEGVDLRKCKGCGTVRYCSVECQRRAWPFHKEGCKSFQKLRDTLGPDALGVQANLALSSWLARHRPILGDAMIASFNLRQNPKAHEEFVLGTRMKYIPEETQLAKKFRLEEVYQTNWKHLIEHHGPVWTCATRDRKRYDDEAKLTLHGYGTGYVAIELDTGKGTFSRAIPITFDIEHALEVPNPHWEKKLRHDIIHGVIS